MKKTIRDKVYDTETADLITSHSVGDYGDPAGYEERLYRSPEGYFFLYGIGGEQSAYSRETIRAVSKARAEEMQKDW